MMRLPSTGWEKMSSTFLEIYLICIINACSYGFLVACEHLWHAWNALVRLFQRIYQAPYPPLRAPSSFFLVALTATLLPLQPVGPDGLPIMIGASARQEPGIRGHPPGSWRKPRVPSHC